MIVAGIDPSLTSAGIAVLRRGEPVLLTSVGHGTLNGRTYRHRSNRIVSQCKAVGQALFRTPWEPCRANPPIDLAVMEGPAYGFTSRPSGHDGAGLWWGIYSALIARKIPVAIVPPTVLKIWATGKGNAEKPAMLAAAKRELWPHVRSHDEADALWLAHMGACKFNWHPSVVLTDWRLNIMDKCEWPEVARA